jgi:hypothetical protein
MSTGNPLSSSTVKHSIVIHLDKAIFLGLGSTNIPDFKSLRKSDMSDKIFKNISFTGDTPFDFVQKLVTDLGGTISYKYNTFNVTSKSYSEVSINKDTILDLIKYHEKNKEEGKIDVEENRKTIRNIQNSLEGAIIGELSIGTSSEKSKAVSIFFLKSNNGNSRKIIPNGIPMIADYPRTDAGTKYSFGETLKHQQSGVNGENIGVYQTLPEDTDNPLDKVAAPLRMSYDRSTSTWNVSNQVLVVAADNIPSANVRSLDEIDALTEGALTPSDFSVGTNDQKPQKGIGNFFTGRGVVFSPERGNPNHFTPNFCACDGEKPVEIIRIVNRSNSNIAKGALLLCNYISGEWIPTVIKEGTFKASSAKNWAFSQFVVSSDFFFKDNRFYTNRTNVEGTSLQDGDPRYSASILPSYKNKVRLKYYADWAEAGILHNTQTDLVKENWARSSPTTRIVRNYTSSDWDLDIPSAYFQFSNFDFVSNKLGGQCVGTILSRTNISYGESIYRVVSEAAGRGEILTVGYDFPHFWGAVLTEGYTTATTANLIGQTVPYIGSGVMVSSAGTVDIANDINIAREFAISRIATLTGLGSYTGQPSSGLFADQADVNFKQLPADIATHASPSGVNGSPIKIPNIIGQLQSLNVYENLRPSMSFLKRTDGKELYDLRPNNSNIIQFTPLSYHTLALDQTRFQQGFKYGSEVTAGYYSVGGGISPELQSTRDNYLPDNPSLFIYDAARDLIVEEHRNSRIWPSRYQSLWRPLNPFLRSTTVKYAPFPWDGTWSSKGRGANTVGIIGASTTINLAGQKEFPISIEQNLGVRPRTVGSGGGGVSIIGSYLTGNWSVASSELRTSTIRFWGNNDAQDSLGGAVLYLQVYEAWEPKDTWFDARYNTVFHFNPQQPSGNTTKEVFQTVAPPAQITNADYTNGILSKNFKRTVDEILTDVEHRVPSTYNHGTKSHDVMSIGTIITKNSQLAPVNEWRVERCRNNKLLPFSYEKLVISLNRSSASILNAGSNFGGNTQYTGAKGVKIETISVNASGGITDFRFPDGFGGEGFLPSDFAGSGYDLKINNATIRFTSGIVSGVVYFDPGPQQVVTPTLISVPSKNGENYGLQSKEATVKVGDFTTANSFDLFFWFQNDVTYTPMYYIENTRNQYIKVALN